MNTYGYIYMTTNLINGKKYIGQHASSTLDENYKGSGTLLRKAVCKYGWDNFKVELIEWCSSQEELDEREIYWIKFYDAVNSDEFYNLQTGGTNGSSRRGSKMSDETKLRMSNALKGNKNPLGHKMSEKTKQTLIECNKGNKYCLGKKHSDETKLKQSQALLGHNVSDVTRQKFLTLIVIHL